jgi:hypothetical protein
MKFSGKRVGDGKHERSFLCFVDLGMGAIWSKSDKEKIHKISTSNYLREIFIWSLNLDEI